MLGQPNRSNSYSTNAQLRSVLFHNLHDNHTPMKSRRVTGPGKHVLTVATCQHALFLLGYLTGSSWECFRIEMQLMREKLAYILYMQVHKGDQPLLPLTCHSSLDRRGKSAPAPLQKLCSSINGNGTVRKLQRPLRSRFCSPHPESNHCKLNLFKTQSSGLNFKRLTHAL